VNGVATHGHSGLGHCQFARMATRCIERLFQKQRLDPADFDDLYAIMKCARGIPDPQGRQPSPLTAAILPANVRGAPHVVLKKMRDLKDVNRIPAGAELEFSPTGMTVVYGDNGPANPDTLAS